jgi:hypothetical protein
MAPHGEDDQFMCLELQGAEKTLNKSPSDLFLNLQGKKV